MAKKLKLAIVLGTRPEVIKLAPVVHEAKKRGHDVRVVFSGQHREMGKALMKSFGIQSDLDLDVMSPGQTLSSLSTKVLQELDRNEASLQDADYLLVQGDTTTAFVAAYWAFCKRIPIAHVEAGLRTYDLDAPFPEEGNRQLIGRIANLHFSPTSQAEKALLREKVHQERVHSVGNTGIDALQFVLKILKDPKARQQIAEQERVPAAVELFIGDKEVVLVTAHRRESFGEGLEGICQGILRLAAEYPDLRFVYPVHPNPKVQETVRSLLGKQANILLCEPLPYVAFVALMSRSKILLTDSGGVQEEAPSLRKPILVLRETTERPEGVKLGFASLVGFRPEKIFKEASKALKQGCQGKGKNPYGDGKASVRIIRALEKAGKRAK